MPQPDSHPKHEWDTLIFVYNADAGLFSLVTDFTHKMISPQTYACNLCKLTFGYFTMKKDWKKFIAGLPVNKVFLHKDEFQKKYLGYRDRPLPAVFGLRNGQLGEIISAKELSAQKNLDALKNILTRKLG